MNSLMMFGVDDVAPACGDVLRIALGVDVAFFAGEECRAGVGGVADGVLISPGSAREQPMLIGQLMVDADRVVLLPLEDRSRPRVVRRVQSVAAGEVVRQRRLRDRVGDRPIEAEPLRIIGDDVVGRRSLRPGTTLPAASTEAPAAPNGRLRPPAT